jgi:glycerol-3-phosphate O-acyltransferase / dihydroxyacetone phosphate acyltransferase
MYVMSRYGVKMVEDEEETVAHNKVIVGLLLSLVTYPAMFFVLWAHLWNTPVGALVAAGTVWLFAVYHNKLINGTIVLLASESLELNRFEQITTRSEGKSLLIHRLTTESSHSSGKRLAATWRVLIGVWVPKRWDLSLAALSQYTTPRIPPANPWIDRPLKAAAAVVPAAVEEPPVQAPPNRKPPPPRRMMRHVLRARAEAVMLGSSTS